MLPRSIRWRLPLSYAIIALLATLALGTVLLATLRSYYAMREHENLSMNAQVVGDIVGRMVSHEQPQDLIKSQVTMLSFVSQARIRLLDTENAVLADSGNPFDQQVLTFSYEPFITGTSIGTGTDDIFLARPAIPAGANGFWVTSIEGEAAARGTTAQMRFTPPADQFSISVEGSPYGIGLRREVSLTTRSDQVVQYTLHDLQNNVLGTIELSNGRAYGTEIINGLLWALVGAGAAAVVLAAGAGWFISRSITAPLLVLTETTAKMANGELSARAQVKRDDEFGLLARSFDEMAQRVETTVATLRRFVADAAHEIQTPLTAAHADLELAASEQDTAQSLMFTKRALTQLKRLEALTNDLLDLSRLEAQTSDTRRNTVDLTALVSEISETFASRAEQAGIAFNVETPCTPVTVEINEIQFRHAIANLLDNAIKFTPENGIITLGVRRDDTVVELWVNDTGIGINDEDLPQIFNRFHRGRNAAAYPGSGLGLAIIKAIVEGHQGEVSVQSQAGNGTRFAVHIPAGAS